MDGRWLAFGSLVWVACRSSVPQAPVSPVSDWVAEAAPDLGPVVARVAGNPIFAEEVRAQSARSGKPPREALDEILAFHLLAERARERGMAAGIRRSEVPTTLLVQRLIEREFEPSADPEDLPDSELRRLYETNKASFVHPRIVRVALLSVYPRRSKAKAEARKEARETALALFEHISRRPARTADDFATVGQDPAWKSRNVAFGRVWQGPNQAFGPLTATAGAAIGRLKKPGDTTALVEEDNGAHHIARYMDEVAPKNVTFEQARDGLARDYYPQWRRETFERFAGRLIEEHQVQVFVDRVLGTPEP